MVNVQFLRCLYNSLFTCNGNARERSLGQGNVITGVCLSTGGSLYDVTSCLAASSHVPSGASVPGPMFLLGGLSLVPCSFQRPPSPAATEASGTHRTGMHSCLALCR